MNHKMTIGGHVIAHNCVKNDYCLEECLRSLAPICSNILVVECESTDETPELLDRLSHELPQLSVVNYEWKPSRNLEWLKQIVHHTRNLINTDWYISMDADEVLSPDQFEVIRNHVDSHGNTDVCGTFHRHTFWKDPQHLIPNGIICNHLCARLGPTEQSLSGDIIEPERHIPIPVEIWHYGHIRKRDALARKAVDMHEWSFGLVPDHWQRAVKGDYSGVDECVPDRILVPYTGSHPKVAHKWLQKHGYKV